MHPKTSIKLLCVMFIWAASWIFIKIALRDIPPYTLAFLRFSTAAPVIYALSLAKFGKENVRITIEEVPTYVILGLTGVTLLYVTEFKALEYTTAINAS
ncbi:MAG: EamA/RhaT family transporter, partial [Thermoplasmata archaeon]